MNDDLATTIVCIGAGIFLLLVYQILLGVGSFINTGDGQYQGTIVETRHHGIFFKTYGVHLKTGENSSVFEDFCVTNKELFNKIQSIEKDKKLLVNYTKKLSTPAWQCDIKDSSDIITDVKIVESAP